MVRMVENKGCGTEVIQRVQASIRGAVQGVGFRPFIYRLASGMKLTGWVVNSPQGVFIEAEGPRADLESFILRLQAEVPHPASIQSLEFSFQDPVGFTAFEIRGSLHHGNFTAHILPDIAACPACLSEMNDPENRRYRYPFTNCTHCGPRFSIVEALPYDRPNTSMKGFVMCAECRKEYEDPLDRRFHAQPNACPSCGPGLQLIDSSGKPCGLENDALLSAAEALKDGRIVAVKGLGGFHLFVDAGNSNAVENLRRRKHREEKPFALMYPSLERALLDCEMSRLERRLMTSPEAPIVLLKRGNSDSRRTVAASVAPNNPYLGIMLPYTPLHHLLMQELGAPVVATSGNLSDEPICIENGEALSRLSGIADLFLMHNRPIVRHADDSIVRIVLGRELVLRRARGYAPLPLHCRGLKPGTLAVGGHLKNTVAISIEENVFISQHIGDLENRESMRAFEKAIESFKKLYGFRVQRVAADMHPGYLSSSFASGSGHPVVQIQHHYAHVAACMAENQLEGRVLGVAWDGTGYGTDGTVWGGEFLLTGRTSFERVASFRKFRLPGGTAAVREPRRTALGLLFEMMGEKVFESEAFLPVQSFSKSEIAVVAQMLRKGIASPWTSSVGRLFDAVASILGLRQRIHFEGQAAMDIEFAIGDAAGEESYPFSIEGGRPEPATTDRADAVRERPAIIDWEAVILSILHDARAKRPPEYIAIKFHNTLAEIIAAIAERVGEQRVVLTGGCFQNRYLLERSVLRLRERGFKPYWHQRIPPNDGCIAPGQVVAASRLLDGASERRAPADAITGSQQPANSAQ